ncbi:MULTISPECIES: hypothetical protein [unclassified Nonomuraea]|uniref:hypothetical protein n=1 Tax=unclassified Nonomuraea TaxID=2593643 RepID=UPI00340289D3
MGTVSRELHPDEAKYGSAAFPQFTKNNGTNGPVSWLAYDAAATETAYWEVTAFSYGSGNITVDLIWGAATATSGVVRWEVAIAAITPEADSQDPETKAYATAVAVDDTHLGTTAKRLHRATVSLSGASLDSIAALDEVWVRIARLGAHANDTLAGDAWLKKAVLSYSDI